MAWQTSPVWTFGQMVASAQLNILSGNVNETAPAKATTAGRHFASVGVNQIAERAIVQTSVETQEASAALTGGSYGNLATAGPAVTLTTGPLALVWINAQLANSAAGQSYASYEVSGAGSLTPNDDFSISVEAGAGAFVRCGICDLRGTTSGSNTFTMRYRSTSATITALRRRIAVMGL